MSRAPNGSIQAMANALTPPRRRVLWELAYINQPASCSHVHAELRITEENGALEARAKWPIRQLRALRILGMVREAHVGRDTDFAITLFIVTPLGANVAKWCFSDGRAATS